MKQRILLILFASLLCCRWTGSLAQNTSNYADTLIHVGAITVSKPFFIRDVRDYIASTNSNKVDSSNLNNWYNNYVDDLLLINCAIDNGIIKRADVEESAVGFANYVLIQKGSLFYQANINSKIIVSPDEIKEAYNKTSSIVNFSLIRFSNMKTYHNALKGQKPSNAIFEGLKNTNNDSINFTNNGLRWPSLEFWHLQYQITSLKVGEISGPVNAIRHEFSNPIYLIRVDSIRQNARLSFDLEKQRLEMTMNMIKEDSLYDHYEKTIFQKVNIQLNKKNLSDSLVQCFINHCTDPKDMYFKPYLKVVLMTYSLNGVPVLVHNGDFLKYYRNLPIRLNFNNRGDVINFLYYFVLSSYMVQDASYANFDKEVKFLALKKDLKNKFGLQKFEEELFDKVSVSDMECKAYYHDHLRDFNGSTNARVTLLTFDSENDAIITGNAIGNVDTTLFEEKVKDKVLFSKIKLRYDNMLILYSDSLKYPVNIIAQVFEAKDNTFCGPFKMNNQVVLVYKKQAYGIRLKSYEESKGQIYLYLKGQKFIGMKESLLKKAREKYRFYCVPTFKQVKNLIQ
jgi:hypothetical protein